MIKNVATTPDLGSVQRPIERTPSRKPYESPRLQEWGSIVKLTGGPLSDITDAEIGGSTGV